jgi:hypothetical protein
VDQKTLPRDQQHELSIRLAQGRERFKDPQVEVARLAGASLAALARHARDECPPPRQPVRN